MAEYITSSGAVISSGVWGSEYVLYGSYITFYGGSSTDVIRSSGNGHLTLYGGGGNDNLEGSTDGYDLIDGGEDNDSIISHGNLSTIYGGSGNDTINFIGGGNNTVSGDAGNDFIGFYSSTQNLIRYASGDGDDTIYGFSYKDTLKITSGQITNSTVSGSDFIVTVGSGTITFKDIYGGDDINVINADGSTSTITVPKVVQGTENADDLDNYKDQYSIEAFDGNDTISNSGNYVTIIGGAGNDSIRNTGSKNVYVYKSGDGNDTIQGFKENDTLKITSGRITNSTVNGADFIVTVGSGTITFKDMYGGADINVVNADGSTSTITVPKVVQGTENADTLTNAKDDYSIEAFDGNDSISNSGNNVTIIGGAGNDSILNTGENILYHYANGDGNDTIQGFKENDTLKITSGQITNSTVSGSDFIVTIGSGTITFKNLEGDTNINVINADGSTSIITVPKILQGTANADTLTNAKDDYSIEAFGGNDSITNSGNNVTIVGGAGNDTITNTGAGNFYIYKFGDGNDVISGIKATDTLQITGAKCATTKSGNDLIIGLYTDSSSIKDLISGVYSGSITVKNGAGVAFKIDGTINGGTTGNDSIENFLSRVTIDGQTGNDSIKNYVSAVSIYGGPGNDTISNSTAQYDVSFTETISEDSITTRTIYENQTRTTTKTRTVYDTAERQSLITGGYRWGYVPAPGGGTYWDKYWDDTYEHWEGVTVTVGSHEETYTVTENVRVAVGTETVPTVVTYEVTRNVSEQTTNEDVTIYGGAGNDVISLDSSAKNNLIQYTNGDGNDTIFGIKANDTLQIFDAEYTTVKNGNDLEISVGTGSILLKAAANIAVNIDGTPADTTPADTTPAGISVSNSILTASSSFTGNAINLADYAANSVNASAVTRAVSIVGTAANNSLRGGSGADTISGGTGNDTLTGGNGADIFVYSGGNDIVTDYTAGQDKIKLTSGTISSASVSGNNVILRTSNGNITIQNGKDKNITVIDSSGTESTNKYPLDTTPAGISISNSILTASSSFTGNAINLADYAATSVNASAVTRAVSIVGTAANNSLRGGSGADTISGGTGNDTLTGGNGADIFVYSGGNDIVTDYTAGQDKIKLTSGTISSASVSGNNVILRTSNGNITIQNGKDKNITVIDSSGTETTNKYPIDTTPAGISVSNSILTASSSFTGNAINLAEYAANSVNASAVTRAVSIVGTAANNSLRGGSGADTISGGTGNDTLTGGNGADIFVYSGGNDIVTDYTAGQDKIKLTSGTISSASVSGNNVILRTSSGNITIQNGKDKNITVIDSSGTETTNKYPAETLPPDTIPTDTLPAGISIKNSVLTASAKFTGTAINAADYDNVTKINAGSVSQSLNITANDAVTSIKGGKNSDTIKGGNGKNTILGGAGDDSIIGGTDNDILKGDAGNDTISGGSGNDTLTGGAGNDIFVYSGGNDFITDYKPGEDKISFNVANIKNSTVQGAVVVLTADAGTVSIKSAKDKAITFDNNGTTTDLIFFGDTYYAPLDTGLTYDAKRTVLTASAKFTGSSINLSNYLSTVTKLNAGSVSQSLNITANNAVTSIKGGKNSDTIKGGNGKNTILGGAGDDSIIGGTDNDILKGDAGNDTISGGSGNDTLTGGAGNDVFIYSGGNDFITDYKTGEDKIVLTRGAVNNSSLKGSDVILYTDGGEITVKSAKNKNITVTDGAGNTTTEIFGRIWYSDDKTTATLADTFKGTLKAADYNSAVKNIDAAQVKAATQIFGNNLDNTISGGSKVDSLHGGGGNDSIYGGAGNDKIFGDTGNDSLNGGAGNDTLTGGAGNDVFIYSAGDGNDVIADFVSGEDVIKLESGTVSNYSVSGGKDAILKIGSNKLTLKNIGNEKITVIGADNTQTVYGLADGLNFDKADLSKAVSVTISADYESNSFDATNYKSLVNIDASANNSKLEITGNAKNNVITASKGGGTLSGGKGNDTLIAGAGADTFIYSAGKDVIANYSANDEIKLSSGKVTKTAYKGDDVIFSVGSGSITVKDGNGKQIKITDGDGVTTSQTYSNSRILKLLEDNNFVTDDFSLDDITEQKFAVQNIETQNYSKIDEQPILTFADKK